MKLSEILKQIRPCDTDNPYIFVSYSSHDCELVWRDVLEFQKQGYNVWLDEKNLDKTKSSWKEDALKAIEDMDCQLVVFYVSENSLISEACYNELSKTIEEYTIALHRGPVKFIAVDVDEIGNIGDFSEKVYQCVYQNKEIGKDVKTRMALTLHNFQKNFFNSNNEKVRVHPKNEKNRKMNYYEEIMASFPDIAKIYEVNSVQKTFKSNEEIIESEAVEEKILVQSDERAGLKQKAIKTETPVLLEKEDERTVSLEFSDQQIRMAITKANDSMTYKFTFAEECEKKKIKNAIHAYAKGIQESEVIAIYDTSVFSSGKTGFLITRSNLYCKDIGIDTVLDLKRIESTREEEEKYIYVKDFEGNEEKLCIYSANQIKLIGKFLESLLNVGSDKKIAENIKEKENTILTKTQVLKAVEYANQQVTTGTGFQSVVEWPEKKIKKAISVYAKGESLSEILALKDTTIMGSGKEGLLVTSKILYINIMKNCYKIKLNELKAISEAEEGYNLIIHYKNGVSFKIFVSSSYKKIIMDFINFLIKEQA